MSQDASGPATKGSDQHDTVVVTDATFEAVVLKSTLPVVVDFWAGWCRPCLAIAPSLEALATEFVGKLIVAKIDVDKNPVSVAQFHVQGFPTLLFFNQGEPVKRFVGAAPRSQLRKEFESFLSEFCNVEQALSDEAEAQLAEAFTVAEAHKEAAEKASNEEFRRMVPAFAEFDAIRIDFFKAIAPELADERGALAQRGAAGEFDEPIYLLYNELSGVMYGEERFSALVKRQNDTISAVNTEENRLHSDAHMARCMAASEAFDAEVDAARARILAAAKN